MSVIIYSTRQRWLVPLTGRVPETTFQSHRWEQNCGSSRHNRECLVTSGLCKSRCTSMMRWLKEFGTDRACYQMALQTSRFSSLRTNSARVPASSSTFPFLFQEGYSICHVRWRPTHSCEEILRRAAMVNSASLLGRTTITRQELLSGVSYRGVSGILGCLQSDVLRHTVRTTGVCYSKFLERSIRLYDTGHRRDDAEDECHDEYNDGDD
jgi:hypothetical protein